MSLLYTVANTNGMVGQLDPSSNSMADASVSMVLNDSSTTRSKSHSTKPALSLPDPRNFPIEIASSNGTTCECKETGPCTQAQDHAVAFAQGNAGQCSQAPMPAGELEYDGDDKSADQVLVGGHDDPTLMLNGWLSMGERHDGIMATISIADSFTGTGSTRRGNEDGQGIPF